MGNGNGVGNQIKTAVSSRQEFLIALALAILILLLIVVTSDSGPQWIYQNF